MGEATEALGHLAGTRGLPPLLLLSLGFTRLETLKSRLLCPESGLSGLRIGSAQLSPGGPSPPNFCLSP